MKLLAWCWTVMTAIFAVIDFASDVLLRSRSDSRNWDQDFGVLLVSWLILMVVVAFKED